MPTQTLPTGTRLGRATLYASPEIRLGRGGTIASRLRLAWESVKRARGEQARLAGAMGVSAGHLSAVLAGCDHCSPASARLAARHLNVKSGWIVDGDITAAPAAVQRSLRDGLAVMQVLEDVAGAIETEVAHRDVYDEPLRRSLVGNRPASNSLPPWLERGLFRYALPHPDITGADWLKAIRWFTARHRVLQNDYGIVESLNVVGREAFEGAYADLLREMARPIAVTLPGHAWIAAHRAVVREFRIDVEHDEDAERGVNRLPKRMRDELRSIPSLSWRALLPQPTEETARESE